MSLIADSRKLIFRYFRDIYYHAYQLKNRPELVIGILAFVFLSFVVLVPLLQII